MSRASTSSETHPVCGRYALFEGNSNPQERTDLSFLGSLELPGLWPPAPRFNVAPTQTMPVIVRNESRYAAESMRWGLVPSWAKDTSQGARTINGRAETAHELPTFRTPFKKRRCLVPASGYYEWSGPRGNKQPYFVHALDGELLWFAGLWDEWTGPDGPLHSYSILTKAADGIAAGIHHRMPALLRGAEREAWLDPGTDAEHLHALLRPDPHLELALHPVTRAIGRVDYQEPDAILPVTLEPVRGSAQGSLDL